MSRGSRSTPSVVVAVVVLSSLVPGEPWEWINTKCCCCCSRVVFTCSRRALGVDQHQVAHQVVLLRLLGRCPRSGQLSPALSTQQVSLSGHWCTCHSSSAPTGHYPLDTVYCHLCTVTTGHCCSVRTGHYLWSLLLCSSWALSLLTIVMWELDTVVVYSSADANSYYFYSNWKLIKLSLYGF